MAAAGHDSQFRLGHVWPGTADTDLCEPHVSLFMLRFDDRNMPDLLAAVRAVAAGAIAVSAHGEFFRHNPHGAPELFYRRTPAWFALQRAVVAAVEPLRQGRLRDTDPTGAPLSEVVARLTRDGTDPGRLSQLMNYGYDEITDDFQDRFFPHVTLAWPLPGGEPVELTGLPQARAFDAVLTDLAVFAMRGAGTCVRRYGGFSLRSPGCGSPVGAAAQPAVEGHS